MSMENYSTETVNYFNDFKEKVESVYGMANMARTKGYDPLDYVEIPIALSMAEKVVGLISTVYPQMMGSGITERILDLEKQYGKLDPTVIFKIADEISDQKFCKFDSILQAMDAGIRVGLCYATLGVVSSPIEGYTGLEIQKTRTGKDYIVANFSGPIRSAGTTASCMVLFLIDYLREKFGYAKYDPTEEEIKRTWAELSDFHERITNLQYMPTEEETLFIAKNMPFQVGGDPSEKLEVSNYKNLKRVNTNFLRSGFCLVLAEGLAQKASKGWRLYNMARKNGIQGSGFDWLEEYMTIHEKRTLGKSKEGEAATYIKDLVAGRPVYGHPSKSGSFRFRYGRGRNSGFSAASIHPATMGITDDFIAIGTQLKIEKPTKGTAITSNDQIEGPIVKLKDGSVRQLKTLEESRKIYSEVEEIIYLGDILFPFSDLANRNAQLIKPGYVEEWWYLELKELNEEFGKKINPFEVSLGEAIEISKKTGISLHPKYIYYWTEISKEEFGGLLNLLKESIFDEGLSFSWTKKDKEKFYFGKRALELLGVPHDVVNERVVLDNISSKALFENLGISLENKEKMIEKLKQNLLIEEENILDIINKNNSLKIRNKAGEFIGARMGRPEKAKLRSIPGSPNSLFVVGKAGGRMKTMQSAYEVGSIKGNFPLYYCDQCKNETLFRNCEVCENKTRKRYFFRDIKEKGDEEKVPYSEVKGIPYNYREINFKYYFDKAREKLKFLKTDLPDVIKGIESTSSGENINERIEKGIIRAKHGLQVFRDGTVRMDGTELPLISFKPKEIGASVEKLKELGYTKDVYGNELSNEEQILEIKPHDVLIPSCSETPDEK